MDRQEELSDAFVVVVAGKLRFVKSFVHCGICESYSY